jgi:hypothetical protein
MKKDVEKIMVVPQFEFTENSINEMIEDAKKECVSEIISDLELKDSEGVIGEIFGLGVRIGIHSILDVINNVAASSNEDSVLHVMFDETTGPMS